MHDLATLLGREFVAGAADELGEFSGVEADDPARDHPTRRAREIDDVACLEIALDVDDTRRQQ